MDLHGPGNGIPPDYFLTVSDLFAIYVYGFQKGLPWVNVQGGVDPAGCPSKVLGGSGGGSPGLQGLQGPSDPSAPLGGGSIGYTVIPAPQFPNPLEQVDVDVYVDSVTGLAGYELGLEVTGGDSGTLDLTRSEEHTSELQSHSFISYAVFCLKKKKHV